MIIAKGSRVGKYRLESPLAQGGMGTVWTARHVHLDRPVAVKFLAPALTGSSCCLARFEREAHAATAIQSFHVVQVQDFGVEDDTPYIVMELLEGEDLGTRLRRVKRLPLEAAANILIQVGRALRRAHAAGIVHRDLKPANLFLAGDDEEEVVKILDFGIAKEQGTPLTDQTEPGTMLGSPHYVSPEQAAGDREIDHRSDLWSLAVVLYHVITGVLPFQGQSMGSVLQKVFLVPPPRMAEVAPDLPSDLDAFFDRALAKRKKDRFQSIGEMVTAFVEIATPDEEVPPSFAAPSPGDLACSCETTLVSRGQEAAAPTVREPAPPSDRSDARPKKGVSAVFSGTARLIARWLVAAALLLALTAALRLMPKLGQGSAAVSGADAALRGVPDSTICYKTSLE